MRIRGKIFRKNSKKENEERGRRLVELIFEGGRGLKVKKKEVKALPRVFAPTEEQLENAAKKVGLEWKNGRLVNGKKKVTNENYERFKKVLLDEMGLDRRFLTAKELMDVADLREVPQILEYDIISRYMSGEYKNAMDAFGMAYLKKYYRKELKEYREGKYKTAREAWFAGVLRKFYPEEFEKYKEGKYKDVDEAFKAATLKEYFPEEYEKYTRGEYKTATEAYDIGLLKEKYPEEYKKYKKGEYTTATEARYVAELKEKYPEELEAYKKGVYRTPEEALYAGRLKKQIDERVVNKFQRMRKEKGLTPEQLLKQILEFEKKSKARKEN